MSGDQARLPANVRQIDATLMKLNSTGTANGNQALRAHRLARAGPRVTWEKEPTTDLRATWPARRVCACACWLPQRGASINTTSSHGHGIWGRCRSEPIPTRGG